jgi:thymidylate synthase
VASAASENERIELMNEIEILKSTIVEYKSLLSALPQNGEGHWNVADLTKGLSAWHDWTERGASELVDLARNYGSFMLRNAFALATAMKIEDGKLDF